MATTKWLTTVNHNLKQLEESAVTVSAIATTMLTFYSAARQKVPSVTKIEQPPQKAMEAVIMLMLDRASKWLKENGDKLPLDQFSMQYGNLFVAANAKEISIYYQNGFALPMSEAGVEDQKTENKIVLAK